MLLLILLLEKTASETMLTIIIPLCLTIIKISAVEQCTTPSGKNGECIPIKTCQELLEALETLNDTQIRFVQNSQCGYDKTPLVCCPGKSTNTVRKSAQGAQTVLSDKRYCGYQHIDDFLTDKSNVKANINEFPWLASLLFLTDQNKKIVQCSGALINNRYILTSAHCTNAPNYKLIGVRLGEYDLQLDTDCAENSQLQDCADPIEEYSIEETKIPSDYNRRNKTSDIALLRLNASVTYTDFIRPICLPFPGTKLAEIGDTLSLSGWGLSSYLGEQVNIKKKVLTELLSNEECIGHYSRNYKHVPITSRQTCTKPKATNQDFACQGDSGGPVMFSNKNQWHIEGVLSFGAGCGLGSPPDVNTKVNSYLDWIVQTVRP